MLARHEKVEMIFIVFIRYNKQSFHSTLLHLQNNVTGENRRIRR